MASLFKPDQGAWSTFIVAAGPAANPDTDGTWIVFDAERGSTTGRDIYYQPVFGGPVSQLSIAGSQSNPSVSGGVIAFESRDTVTSPADIFVYVIATNTLYQVTSTALVNDGSGRNLSSPSIVVHATTITRVSATADGPLDVSSNANPDLDFRYDAGPGGYIFSLSTKGLTTATYNLNFRAAEDAAEHSARFAVR